MKGDNKYYAIIIFVFLVLFLIQQFQKPPTNYDRTYSHRDKNPYGGYVLKDILPEFMGDSEIRSLNLTLYEIQDEDLFDKNLIVFAEKISVPKVTEVQVRMLRAYFQSRKKLFPVLRLHGITS